MEEEGLKGMMGGDVRGLERRVGGEEEGEIKSEGGGCGEKEEKKRGCWREEIKKRGDGGGD